MLYRGSSVVNSTTAYLQWSDPAVFDDEYGIDTERLQKYLQNNTFLAQYITIYMYDFSYAATRHTINEFLVMAR